MESQEKFWSFHLSIFDRFESDPEEQLTDRAWGRLALFLLVNWYNLTVIVVFNAGNVPFVHLSIHLNLGSQFANAWRLNLRSYKTYLDLTSRYDLTSWNFMQDCSKSAEIRWLYLCWLENSTMAVTQELLISFLNFGSWVSLVEVTPRPASAVPWDHFTVLWSRQAQLSSLRVRIYAFFGILLRFFDFLII